MYFALVACGAMMLGEARSNAEDDHGHGHGHGHANGASKDGKEVKDNTLQAKLIALAKEEAKEVKKD